MGAALVEVLERLSVFNIFRSVWFSAALTLLVVSIVVCTLDRTPKLWRGVADIRVDQPEPYFDPRLPDRAAMTGVAAADARTVLRRNHFRVREASAADGTTFLYGDRHQFTKMATLLTHTGLVLFLVAAAVTSRLGDEQGLVVPEGESLTVQPIGTPGLLLVKNLDFEAPGFDTGQASRLHHGPRRLPERPADRAQDHPGQRPAVDRRLHVPPERVRAGAVPHRQGRGRAAAVGRRGPADRCGRRLAIRHPPGPGPRHRPRSSCSARPTTARRSC